MENEMYYDFNDYYIGDGGVEVINDQLNNNHENIYGLGLNFGLIGHEMTSDDFINLTNILEPERFLSIQVIDISDSYIEENIAFALALWLDLKTQPYIIMTGTRISLKRIYKLYDKFNEVYPNKVNDYMKRIIFMSQGYVKKASGLEQYIKLVNEGKLPYNWALIHDKFYENEFYRGLMRQRKWNLHVNCWERMRCLTLTSKNNTVKNDEEVYEDDGNEMSFNECLRLLTFHDD